MELREFKEGFPYTEVRFPLQWILIAIFANVLLLKLLNFVGKKTCGAGCPWICLLVSKW